MDEPKPRIGLCWLCGNHLRGNHFAEIEIDGHVRILHKACAERPDFWYQVKSDQSRPQIEGGDK